MCTSSRSWRWERGDGDGMSLGVHAIVTVDVSSGEPDKGK